MKFLRAAICALVVFGVAAHGCVEDWVRAVFVTGAGLLFVAWALWMYFTKEEQVVFSPLLPPLGAFSLVVCGHSKDDQSADSGSQELHGLECSTASGTRATSSTQMVPFILFSS